MPAPRELDPSASALAFFGAELRRARLAAGKTQEQLARLVNYSASLVGAVETATQTPPPDLAERADEALGTDGLLTRLWEHWVGKEISRARLPVWFRPFVQYEARATVLWQFEPVAVPGLLQTEDYARAVIRTGHPGEGNDEIEALVTARMERQTILDRANPPTLVVLLQEGVLSHVVGTRQVMHEQMEILLKAAQRPKVILQIVPESAGVSASAAGMFTIAKLDDNGGDVVYFETVATGQVTDRADDVAACATAFEVLRAEALPREASLDLIRRRLEEYES